MGSRDRGLGLETVSRPEKCGLGLGLGLECTGLGLGLKCVVLVLRGPRCSLLIRGDKKTSRPVVLFSVCIFTYVSRERPEGADR